ncbi:MAG: hypothetical protein PHF23_11165, partial [Smithellaceae bacterium]|nr:hypothetical protein [Smithellaceae bacterium]
MGTISNRVLISACYGGEDRAAASWRWFHRWIFRPGSYGLGAVCLDFDSTVVTRNGQQQGACRGYNPARPGRASHHPLLAFIADFR